MQESCTMTSLKSDKRRRRRSSGSGSSNGSSFGIFKCFRPTIRDVDHCIKSGLWAKGRVASLPPPSPSLTDGSPSFKKSRGGFRAGLKAAFSDGSRVKKSRKGKHLENSDDSLKGGSFKLSLTSSVSEYSDSNEESVLTSSLSLDSSQFSYPTSSSQSPDCSRSRKPLRTTSFISSRRQCIIQEQKCRSYSGTGLCILLVTLLVLLLWGKMCAIICTSGLLYITAHRSIKSKPEPVNQTCDRAPDSADNGMRSRNASKPATQ